MFIYIRTLLGICKQLLLC